MGTFKITTNDGTFQVEAATADDALAALDKMSSKDYMGPSDKNGVPEGMVFDPATNRMVDTKALAQHEVPGGSWAGDALKGMPFIGSYADELAGYLTSSNDTKNHPNESQQIQTDVVRQSQDTFEKNNPKTALASKLAVGATALPAVIMNAPALPTAGFLGGQLGRTLLGATIGGAAGATEGAISGYGEGENKDKPAYLAAPQGQVNGLIAPGNIDLAKRPVVKMPNGDIATVRSMSFEENGKEILVPTVSPDGKLLSDKEAIDLYHKTGQHLGVFDNPQSADAYAQKLHEAQASYYAPSENNRLAKAGDHAMWGGALGTVLGGAAPLVSDAASSLVRPILDHFTVNRNLAQIGLSRPAADAVQSAMRADDALGPAGLARINRAGPDGMLADAGDSAAALLDTTIQKSGRAGNIARQAVIARANAAGQRLRGTMDITLGRPPGIDQAARDIAQRTAAARSQAYRAAYNAPIDYAAQNGRAIEDVFNRTPPRIMRQAIDIANEAMVINRQPNRQIMANIADDGTITFREMPNMQQVDELKKALQEVARGKENVDEFGRMSGRGQRIDRLARELRNAAQDAVPEYRTAVNLGGDKIGEDDALRLGNELLSPSTTRESVHEFADGMTDEQRRQLALGLRQAIDEKMANVKTVLSDPNMDAREATAALKDMSSRAAHNKMTTALGAQRANALFAEIQRAQAALELKANVATNSKTFARTEINRSVEDRGKDSIARAALKGEPLQAGKRIWQRLTGADAASEQARSDAVYADIATLMTGARGQAAQAALQRLTDAYRTGALNQDTARQVGKILSGGGLLPSYQLATQK